MKWPNPKISKKSFTVCVIGWFLFPSTSFEKTGQNDLKRDNLIGKVKIVEEIDYKAHNEDGVIAMGTVTDKTSTSYNAEGIEVKIVYHNYEIERGKDFGGTDLFSVNNKGQKIACAHTRSNGNWTDSSFYDAHGNKIRCISYNADSSVHYITSLQFDKKGREIENTISYPAKTEIEVSITTEINYDDSKGLIESKSYKTGDTAHLQGREIEFLNDVGIPIESRFYNRQGNFAEKSVVTYDGYGNQVSQYVTDSLGSIMRKQKWEYEYDKTGNWIKRIFYHSDKPLSITVRKLKYY